MRSELSAASCFWRAGDRAEADRLLRSLQQAHPTQAAEIQQVSEELAREYPAVP